MGEVEILFVHGRLEAGFDALLGSEQVLGGKISATAPKMPERIQHGKPNQHDRESFGSDC
jgi:hypothetical protein